MTKIAYTMFDDVHAATCTQHATDWDHFASEIERPREYPSKNSMPLVKLATFGDLRTSAGSLRHDANVLEVHGIECDYDGGVLPIEQAHAALELAGIEAALYTTPSHSAQRPRWRVFAPLSAPSPPAARRQFVAILNEVLGGVLAVESFALSQSFYVGKAAGAGYVALRSRGRRIDDGFEHFYEGVYPADERDDAKRKLIDPTERALMFANVTDETMQDIRSAVAALGPHRYGKDSYFAWFEIIRALNSLRFAGREREAYEIALAFSKQGGDAFDPRVFERKWREVPHSTTYKTIFDAAQKDGWINPRSARPVPDRVDGGREDLTDTGNVNVLHRLTGGNLRHVTERKAWMHCTDGRMWTVDEAGGCAMRAAHAVGEFYIARAKELEAEADKLSGDDRKRMTKLADSLRSWSNNCRNKRGIDNMLALAARDDRFAISASELDRDPNLFGAANGVIDLTTGELRDCSREQFITKRSTYEYKPDATAPRWLQFIGEITAEPLPGGKFNMRPTYAAYVQRAIGYWATGSTAEHKMFVAVGDGSNGKSVLFDVLAEVLGPYCVQIPPDSMMASGRDHDGERPTPFARNLAGARLAFGSEAKEGHKLNAAWVKKQTGDAKLTARGLHENAFTFEITHKLVLLTNHEPHLDHMDEATRGRIHTWPFDCRWNRPGVISRNPNLPDGDKHLMQRLNAEAEGVLAWIVAGAVAYHREGLEPPQEVVARTSAYFEQQDAFAQWLATMDRCAAAAGTLAADLFASFRAFCAVEGAPNASPSTAK